jgi:N-acetylglucosaminyldiphosphoundecaprenol N-acetyl-beta-D-mannosaminyltransferase
MGKANVLGVMIDEISLEEVLDRIDQVVNTKQRALITHANVMGVNIAYEQDWFRQFLNKADLVYCDGMGVLLGARLLGYHIPERFTLADWIWQLAERAEKQAHSIFFLGNPPGSAEKAAARLKEYFPDLCIVGAHHGFFDKTPGSLENIKVVEQINAARPDLLLVGFGMPTQEKWLKDNWLTLNVNVAITCGALFEYIAGYLKRGPHWMTQNYLEWLVRSIIAPKRYTIRYLRDNPLFLYRLLKQRIPGTL